jgi:hypothetical protein
VLIGEGQQQRWPFPITQLDLGELLRLRGTLVKLLCSFGVFAPLSPLKSAFFLSARTLLYRLFDLHRVSSWRRSSATAFGLP